MRALELVNLPFLMERTSGNEDVKVALIDGPVAVDHPDIAGQNIQEVAGRHACSSLHSVACMHGTFIAGILCAKRGSIAPAICPACTLLVRPIFSESPSMYGDAPSAEPQELALAIIETMNAGAKLINLSAALVKPSAKSDRILGETLDHAAKGNVIVVAAAGNHGTIGSSVITRHPWVIPVAGCDLHGRPTSESNLGTSIGLKGLMAPARGITSIGSDDKPRTSGGTSAAAAFVTGTIALLMSEFRSASAPAINAAIRGGNVVSRRTIVPPLLNAWAAYQAMTQFGEGIAR